MTKKGAFQRPRNVGNRQSRLDARTRKGVLEGVGCVGCGVKDCGRNVIHEAHKPDAPVVTGQACMEGDTAALDYYLSCSS